jgi:hypothetical protein
MDAIPVCQPRTQSQPRQYQSALKSQFNGNNIWYERTNDVAEKLLMFLRRKLGDPVILSP